VRDRLRRSQRGLQGLRLPGGPARRRDRPAPQYVSTDEIDPEAREAEKRVFEEKAREEGKPDNIVEKIVEGQLGKWASEVALLDQTHVNAEKHDSKTIEELRQELAAKTGENIRIARFSYFRIGED
jgi:elongation factor Ts